MLVVFNLRLQIPEIVAISALREDAEAPKFNDGMLRVSTHTNSKLYSVKPGYFVKSTGTETGGTLQVASSSYNCVPSYDD